MPRTASSPETRCPSTPAAPEGRGRSASPAAKAAAGSTSLENLETTQQNLLVPCGTPGYGRQDLPLRLRIAAAFEWSENANLQKRGLKILDCCKHPVVAADASGKARVIWQCCRDRLCPGCQTRRGQELTRRVSALISRWNSCRMVTLTKKHTGQTLPMMLDEVADAFRELRRTPMWRRAVKGGVYVYEVTRGAKGESWHAHVHVLCDGEFLKQKELSAEWLRITGDSPVVHVKYIHQRETGASYVARYVGKPTGLESWNGEEIVEYAVAVHRRRLIHTFGRVHKAGTNIEPREVGGEAVEHVTSVAEFKRASERGDQEASWALERLMNAFLLPKPERKPVADEDLRRVVEIGRRLDAERERRLVDGPPRPTPNVRTKPPPRVEHECLFDPNRDVGRPL